MNCLNISAMGDIVLMAVKQRALGILEQYRRAKLSGQVSRQFAEILMDQGSHPTWPRHINFCVVS